MLSWNELLDNLKGDVQDKSKNPFFGAFIVTWSIRNWELFFKIFDIDKSNESRIEVVKIYLSERPEYDFWITILITFGVIFLGYVFLNIARVFSNVFEKILTPWIYKWTAGKSSIILKEEYEKVVLREEKIKEKLYKEKQEKEQLEIKVEELEKEIIELRKSEYNLRESKVDRDENINIQEYPEKSVKEQQIELESDEKLKIDKVVSKVKQKSRLQDFIDISAEILSGISQSKSSERIQFFVSNKLIQFNGDDSSLSHGYGFYSLTDLGNKVLDKINEEDSPSD